MNFIWYILVSMTPLTNSSPLVKALDSGVTISGAFFDDDDYLDYTDSLRRDWKNNPTKTNYTARQWIEMYPELRSMFERLVREKRDEVESLQIELNVVKQDPAQLDIGSDLRVEEEIMGVEKDMRWFQLGLVDIKTNANYLTDDQIQQARDFPIEELINTKRIRRMWCCPFHEEDSPSFHIYPNNGWHCFGCQAHGSNAVDFVMKKQNLSFVESVKFLLGGAK